MERVFLHYLEQFVTTEKKTTKKHAFWNDLKRFGIWDFFKHKVTKAYILSLYDNIWNFRKTRSVSKACVLILFGRIWNCLAQVAKACLLTLFSWIFLKIRTMISAFWRYLKRYFGYSENILKIRTVNGAFCRDLIRCFDLQRKFWKQ